MYNFLRSGSLIGLRASEERGLSYNITQRNKAEWTLSLSLSQSQKSMASRDKKPSKPSSSRPGGIRTLSDLNRPSADSDSDSDGPQEYYTGGEKRSLL